MASMNSIMKNIRDESFGMEDGFPPMEKMEALSAIKLLKRFLFYGRFDVFAVDSPAHWEPIFPEETAWNVQSFINDVNFGGLIPKFMENLIDIKNRMSSMAIFNIRVPYVLAVISKLPEHRPLALTTAVTYLRVSEEFLLFIKFSFEIHPLIIDDLLINAIENWYGGDPRLLAKEVTSNPGDFYGWSHERLIKLADLRTDVDPSRAAVYEYARNGNSTNFTCDFSPIWNYFFDIEHIKENPTVVADIITTRKLQPSQINPDHLEERFLWEKLVPNMDLRELLHWIPVFHECGFFHETNGCLHDPFVKVVIDRLRESTDIHPSRFLLTVQEMVNSFRETSPEAPQTVTEVIEELRLQMLRSFRTVRKTQLKITILIECHGLDRRCGPQDLVEAKVAAATVAFSIKSAALKAKVYSIDSQPVQLDCLDLYDTIHSITNQSAHEMTTAALSNFLKENTEDDLYVVVGYQTNHSEYRDVIEYMSKKYHGRKKYVFCNLGPIDDLSPDEEFVDELDNLLVTSCFSDLTCDVILGFGSCI